MGFGQYDGQGVHCGESTASEVFLTFTSELYQHLSVFLLFALFNDEPEVFFPKYSQTAIVHAAHFPRVENLLYIFFVCFTRYLVFRIAVLPHRPGVVYYHLLLRRETRIPGVAPFSFRIGIWDLFVHRGQKSYTPTAFGKLWTTPGVRCMKHASS